MSTVHEDLKRGRLIRRLFKNKRLQPLHSLEIFEIVLAIAQIEQTTGFQSERFLIDLQFKVWVDHSQKRRKTFLEVVFPEEELNRILLDHPLDLRMNDFLTDIINQAGEISRKSDVSFLWQIHESTYVDRNKNFISPKSNDEFLM